MSVAQAPLIMFLTKSMLIVIEATVLFLTFAARVGGENGAAAVCAKTFSPSSTSGGGPVIRVGLSRNARVKPLHAKVSIQNT